MENIYRRERLVSYLAHPRTQARRRSCPGDAARKRTLAAPLPSQPASPAHRRTLLPASSLVGDSRAHNASWSLWLPRLGRRQPPPLRLEFRGFSGFVYAFAQLLCWTAGDVLAGPWAVWVCLHGPIRSCPGVGYYHFCNYDQPDFFFLK
jgi:hypothetical protein